MYHDSHVRFVDTHAEGVGSHHDAHLVLPPVVLALLLDLEIQAGMICRGRYAGGLQEGCNLARALAAAHIHYGRAGRAAEYVQHLADLGGCRAYYVGQVAARETHPEQGRILHGEVMADVLCHLGRGGGGQRQYGSLRRDGPQRADIEVGGAEIVSPLRDAVCFVYHDKADVKHPQPVHELLGLQTFGSDV